MIPGVVGAGCESLTQTPRRRYAGGKAGMMLACVTENAVSQMLISYIGGIRSRLAIHRELEVT